MPGFFEAMANMPEPRVKKHMVTIQGKEIEVELAKKIEIMRSGEDKYMLEGDEIIMKPIPKTNKKFPVLCTDENGYKFYTGDPYWVQGTIEEGYTWQIERE